MLPESIAGEAIVQYSEPRPYAVTCMWSGAAPTSGNCTWRRPTPAVARLYAPPAELSQALGGTAPRVSKTYAKRAGGLEELTIERLYW